MLGRASTPAAGARLTLPQISSALRRGGRKRNIEARARQIQAALRTEQLAAPEPVTTAFAATTRAQAGLTVRELVHIDDPDQILRWRDDVVDLVCDIATSFDLDMTIQVATDPFFATVAAAKRLWQQSMESKYEIRLTVGHDHDGQPRSIAAGSVNLHGTFFAERFDIRTHTGQPAGTACVGLGIERWAFAIFAQHGFDPARWPPLLRDQTFADTPSSLP